MIVRTLIIVSLLIGCEARSATPTSSAKQIVSTPDSHGSKILDAKPQRYEKPDLALVKVPITRVAVGQNVWLETVKSPEQALAGIVSEGLAGLGTQLAAGNILTGNLPGQPVVTWVNRTKGIQRRAVLDLEVVLNRGFLEHLISRSEAGKDHESILSSNFDAEILHTALLGAGLQPGKPAKFLNDKRELDYKPATGDPIRIYLEYNLAPEKTELVPAQTWVVGAKDGKILNTDWVYAGSFKGKSVNGEGVEYTYFGANDGRVVCLTNFSTSLLDLPFESVNSDPNGDSLGYKANTEAIPERGTKVRAIFEAAPKGK